MTVGSTNSIAAVLTGTTALTFVRSPWACLPNTAAVALPYNSGENQGAVVDTAGATTSRTTRLVTLPAVAVGGYDFYAHVSDAAGMRVQAPANVQIEIAGVKSLAAGYVESTTVGATLHLVAVSAVLWVGYSVSGVWTVQVTP